MRALLAIVWAVLVALLGWRAVAAKAPEIQEDIRSRTAAVIAPLLPTANVEVDGRFVTLRGEAPDEAALKNVVNAARRVDGALGPWNGLWVAIKAPAEDASAARVVELEAALAKARSEADSALARAGELDVLIAKLTADADAAKARIAELEKLAAGAGDADKLRADLDAAKAALATAEARLAAADTAAADSAARADAADKSANEAKAALEAANRRVAELEAALAAKPAAPALTADECNAAMLTALSAGGVAFETNSAVVTPEGSKAIIAVAAEAVACARAGDLTVEVGGHTDDRGKDDANLKLSQRRADAVRDALVLRNVPGDAVTAVGYGETKPIGDNQTEDGRKANRRIEFTWTAR